MSPQPLCWKVLCSWSFLWVPSLPASWTLVPLLLLLLLYCRLVSLSRSPSLRALPKTIWACRREGHNRRYNAMIAASDQSLQDQRRVRYRSAAHIHEGITHACVGFANFGPIGAQQGAVNGCVGNQPS